VGIQRPDAGRNPALTRSTPICTNEYSSII
jgi:hypothetical protein